MGKISKKYFSREEALIKLQKYCAYQERCHQEVRNKLLELGIYGNDLEEVIVELIAENFLNEERFATAYARGKFHFKKWGRNRIQHELKARDISAFCLKKAMQEIEEEAYLTTLEALIQKKNAALREENLFKRKNKLARYAIGRGFESHFVWEILNQLFPR